MKSFFSPIMKKTVFAGIVVLGVFLAGLITGGPAAAESQTIVAFGGSRIYNDVASAKNAAVSRGLLSAVQTAAAQLISHRELTENFGTIAGMLSSRQDAFIQDYRILKEFRSEKHYQVLVQATVSKQKIKQAFSQEGIQTESDQMPAVLLMVAEKNTDDLGFDYWWRQGYGDFSQPASVSPIKRVFTRKGFTLVQPDSGGGSPGDLFSGIDPGARPSDHEASLLANRLNADIVIVGTAVAEATSNRMGENTRTFKADVELRVIDAGTGKALTTVQKRALTTGEDPDKESKDALADAAYQAGKHLADRVAPLWRNAEQAGDQFMIRVQGDSVLLYLEDLRSALREQSGISGIQTSEMTGNSATLTVDFKGTARELANHLLVQSFDRFGINIREISEDGMSVQLTRN
ncbi:MAG: hypothetical protein K9K62_03535 [Desulfobacteraceae bacterium]|nr:hypothetical protein [Desulfobacteraceae bacterium]